MREAPVPADATGGCQCGTVRYRIAAMLPGSPHLCHCRMCQKAVGGPFAALLGVPDEAVTWTRGKPGAWRSSSEATRGFCAACGTPLFYHGDGSGRINLTIASLDDPAVYPPLAQMGSKSRLDWVDRIAALPDRGETGADDPDWLARIAASNRQRGD